MQAPTTVPCSCIFGNCFLLAPEFSLLQPLIINVGSARVDLRMQAQIIWKYGVRCWIAKHAEAQMSLTKIMHPINIALVSGSLISRGRCECWFCCRCASFEYQLGRTNAVFGVQVGVWEQDPEPMDHFYGQVGVACCRQVVRSTFVSPSQHFERLLNKPLFICEISSCYEALHQVSSSFCNILQHSIKYLWQLDRWPKMSSLSSNSINVRRWQKTGDLC